MVAQGRHAGRQERDAGIGASRDDRQTAALAAAGHRQVLAVEVRPVSEIVSGSEACQDRMAEIALSTVVHADVAVVLERAVGLLYRIRASRPRAGRGR